VRYLRATVVRESEVAMVAMFARIRRWFCCDVVGAYASAYSVPITTGSFTTPQLSLPIPKAGKYLIWAKVWVTSGGGTGAGGNARVDCKLMAAGGDIDNSGATLGWDVGSMATITLLTAWEFFAPSSVDLYCLTFFNTPAEAANIKMSAIRIDDLTHGTLP
jgi:hypothetical protein